jgi:hypothetical protein
MTKSLRTGERIGVDTVMTRYSIALMLSAGCGLGVSSAPGLTYTGMIDGTKPMLHAASSRMVMKDGDSYLLIGLSPYADACGAPGVAAPGSVAFEFALVQAGAQPHQTIAGTDPGVYNTDFAMTTKFAEIDAYDRDASCMPLASDASGNGTVTLTGGDMANGFAGSFDFTVGSDGWMKGSFTTEGCTSPEPPDCQ